jgi:hypothetical protein
MGYISANVKSAEIYMGDVDSVRDLSLVLEEGCKAIVENHYARYTDGRFHRIVGRMKNLLAEMGARTSVRIIEQAEEKQRGEPKGD